MTKFVITNIDPKSDYRIRIIKTETSVVHLEQQVGAVIEGVYTVNGCLSDRPTPARMWSMNTDLPMWDSDNTTNMWFEYPMWNGGKLLWSRDSGTGMWSGDSNQMWSSPKMWSVNNVVLMWN